MWESRRDFQRVWKGWEAGLMAFHAFHTLSFPRPAYTVRNQGFEANHRRQPAFGLAARHELFIIP